MADSEARKGDAVSILGLSTAELAGLSADELTGNPVAIKMLLHYYRQLVDENISLRNNNNTLTTYVSAYERHRSSSGIGAILLAVSNISIGFGVNLLTSGTVWPGVMSLGTGVALSGAGIYLTFRRG